MENYRTRKVREYNVENVYNVYKRNVGQDVEKGYERFEVVGSGRSLYGSCEDGVPGWSA